MSFLPNIFRKPDRTKLAPLYAAIVAAARDPAWYRKGEVPDTIDGRFDMVAAILALVLLRLEAEGERARAETVVLTERFIDDMDGSVRQLGTGDVMVGKQIGKMMGALGGRLAAFRGAIERGDTFDGATTRNIFHNAPTSDETLAFVSGRLRTFWETLQATPAAEILAGEIPSR